MKTFTIKAYDKKTDVKKNKVSLVEDKIKSLEWAMETADGMKDCFPVILILDSTGKLVKTFKG
jgi:hypothetical protein